MHILNIFFILRIGPLSVSLKVVKKNLGGLSDRYVIIRATPSSSFKIPWKEFLFPDAKVRG